MRTTFAQAIAKLIEAHRDRRVSVPRCAEMVAKHLESTGDAAGSAVVREAVKKCFDMPSVVQIRNREGPVEWCEPCDLTGELVLDAVTGPSLTRLAVELEAAPRVIAAGIDAPTRALFSGPSGTGKTLAARWLGGKLGMPVALVRLDRTVSSYMGSTAANLAKVFEEAASCPSIVFIDEVDGICARRDKKDDVGEAARITSALLQQLDLLPPAQIVVAATNFVEHVDPALVRRLPGRVSFGVPEDAARRAMVKRWWAKVEHEDGAVDLAVQATEGTSGAAVRAVAMAAARAALLDDGTIRTRHVDAVRVAAREQEQG